VKRTTGTRSRCASLGPVAEVGEFPEQVATPVGWVCAECDKPIEEGDEGRVIQWEGSHPKLVAYHKDCFDEAASMGIGG
jgi:hypothetical protein